MPVEDADVLEEYLDDRETTIVRLTYFPYGGITLGSNAHLTVSAIGSARKSSDDRWDGEIGYALAKGRALENLGRKIQRLANGAVKHKEVNSIHATELRVPFTRKEVLEKERSHSSSRSVK